MADTSGTNGTTGSDDGGGSHWLRWLVLIALAIATVAAGRKWALSKSDREFEQRLLEADRSRN